MEKSKVRTIVKRVITSLVLAPVVLWAVFNGAPTINVLALLGGALLSWEWATMVPNKKPVVYAVSYCSFVCDMLDLVENGGGATSAFADTRCAIYYSRYRIINLVV